MSIPPFQNAIRTIWTMTYAGIKKNIPWKEFFILEHAENNFMFYMYVGQSRMLHMEFHLSLMFIFKTLFSAKKCISISHFTSLLGQPKMLHSQFDDIIHKVEDISAQQGLTVAMQENQINYLQNYYLRDKYWIVKLE